MSMRMVCCTLLFFCSHVQIFFIKRRAAKWNSLWKTLFKQPVMFGLVGCVLWLNSCDHPLCLTYWRSLIPAVAVLTVGLVCCTAIHPWRKGNHTAKDEPIDELQGYCNSTRDDGATKIGFRILGGAVIDSSSPPPQTHMLDCHINNTWNGYINALSCTFEKWMCIIGFPSTVLYSGLSVSLIGFSVKLKSPQNLNK